MSSASPKHRVNLGFLSPVAVAQRYEVCQGAHGQVRESMPISLLP